MGSDHRETLICMNDLAAEYHVTGQLDRGLRLSEQSLTRSKRGSARTIPRPSSP